MAAMSLYIKILYSKTLQKDQSYGIIQDLKILNSRWFKSFRSQIYIQRILDIVINNKCTQQRKIVIKY